MDPYKILGVESSATDAEIKTAYKKQAMKHHPDTGGDENKFKEINEAYARIKDPSKFEETTPGGFTFRRGGNVDDIFKEFFGFHQRQQQNIQMSLWISLEDVLEGAEKLVSVSVQNEVKSVKLKVPLATPDGGRVKYTGIGPKGADVYVTYRIHAHKRFERINRLDIQTYVDINFWDLILGTTIPFTTLDGKNINIQVPKKTSPTASLKLAKQGLQNHRQQGDCYVKINAIMPTNIDDETIQFLMQKLGR